MDNIYKRVEVYLKKIFPRRKLIIDKTLIDGEVYGSKSSAVLVQEIGDVIKYKLLTRNE